MPGSEGQKQSRDHPLSEGLTVTREQERDGRAPATFTGEAEEELKGREKGRGVAPEKPGMQSVGEGSCLRERKVGHTRSMEGGISQGTDACRCRTMKVSKVMPDAS